MTLLLLMNVHIVTMYVSGFVGPRDKCMVNFALQHCKVLFIEFNLQVCVCVFERANSRMRLC